MRKPLLLLFSLVLACGDSGDATGNPRPVAATIFELQTGDVNAGTDVEVNAYITAISNNGGRVWLSDTPVATAWSGIEVFRGDSPSALGASVGDRVLVTGRLQEFSSGPGLAVTQIASPEFTVITPAAASPTPLTGLSLATITQDPIPGVTANGEPYEGVLVQIASVEVTGTAPFTLSDGVTSFRASNLITALIDPVGTCFASVTGIWNYDVNADVWVIVPRNGGFVTAPC